VAKVNPHPAVQSLTNRRAIKVYAGIRGISMVRAGAEPMQP
jgi:hypothetical protein